MGILRKGNTLIIKERSCDGSFHSAIMCIFITQRIVEQREANIFAVNL